MRFLGQSEISEFLVGRPDCGSLVRAWVSELKHRDWDCAAALQADFRLVDISALPTVTFHLQPATLRIDTLIDFRRRIVLLIAIGQAALATSAPYGTA